MLHVRVQAFLALMLLLDFLVIDLPKSMYELINAEMTPESASEESARKI